MQMCIVLSWYFNMFQIRELITASFGADTDADTGINKVTDLYWMILFHFWNHTLLKHSKFTESMFALSFFS